MHKDLCGGIDPPLSSCRSPVSFTSSHRLVLFSLPVVFKSRSRGSQLTFVDEAPFTTHNILSHFYGSCSDLSQITVEVCTPSFTRRPTQGSVTWFSDRKVVHYYFAALLTSFKTYGRAIWIFINTYKSFRTQGILRAGREKESMVPSSPQVDYLPRSNLHEGEVSMVIPKDKYENSQFLSPIFWCHN